MSSIEKKRVWEDFFLSCGDWCPAICIYSSFLRRNRLQKEYLKSMTAHALFHPSEMEQMKIMNGSTLELQFQKNL